MLQDFSSVSDHSGTFSGKWLSVAPYIYHLINVTLSTIFLFIYFRYQKSRIGQKKVNFPKLFDCFCLGLKMVNQSRI